MKSVCMFVWNHFTNDARVLRECSALAEAGYEVDLIALQDPKNKELPKEEMRPEGFRVIRVKRQPSILVNALKFAKKTYQWVSEKRTRQIGAGLVGAGLFLLAPITMLALGAAIGTVLLPQVRKQIVNASAMLEMVFASTKKSYDFYHANDLNTLPQALLAGKVFNKGRIVYDSHEVQTDRTGYGYIQSNLEGWLLPFVDTMMVENHTRAAHNEELYGFYPYVLHNYPFYRPLDFSLRKDLHALLDLPKDEKILLYQGGIQAGRGLEQLVLAAKDFKEGTLVMIGDGKLKPTIQQLIETEGVGDRVKMIDKVPVEALPYYTMNAYLGFQVLNNVCFNHYSASSNKLFEYLMAEVPVVSCDFPEIERVVAGNDVGVLVDSHDPQSIADGVNRMIEDQALYARVKENTKTAREKYNWDLEKEALLNVYANAAERKLPIMKDGAPKPVQS
ncbi:glycosyltransferase [Exiguobacterium sp. s181]|uniref:glycosyltransferase n=1 Tax=Exiguobacterium sp. s181 TaxID=2751288 RepID=UPI001BEB3C0A|nr:glycosyltransferase [Exiguobacterium sp. s181]